MKKIKILADQIEDELEGAKCYAEAYLEQKVMGNAFRANKYKEMANNELTHAQYLHEFAVDDIDRLKEVYTPPTEMQDKWDKLHRVYVEKASWVKQMLTM